MKLHSLIIFIICCFASTSVYPVEFDDVLNRNNFKEYPIPIYGDSAWTDANRSSLTYSVQQSNGTIRIREDGKSDSKIIEYNAGNIKYKGTNRGEWRGELTATFSDGTKKKLIDDNIVSINQYKPKHLRITDDKIFFEDGKSGLYIFTGLSHLGSSQGAIYVVEDYDTHPAVKRLTILPDAPLVTITDKNNNDNTYFIIIGPRTVMTYDPNRDTLEILLIDQFWWGMYPKSAVKKNDEILIGMRSGVVVVNISGSKKVRYFKKDESNQTNPNDAKNRASD